MGCEHKFVESNDCLKCGLHFAAALFAGGPRTDNREPLSPERWREALDLLVAEYLREHPGKVASKTSVLELLLWAREHIEATDASGGRAS